MDRTVLSAFAQDEYRVNDQITVTARCADLVASHRGPTLAGVFLVTPGAGNGRLTSWGTHLGALVFSPFAGDVERGAVAGIYVSDRILPVVNLAQAQSTGVSFKPFFVQVAKSYD